MAAGRRNTRAVGDMRSKGDGEGLWRACGPQQGCDSALEWELLMVLSGNVHDLTFLKYHSYLVDA